MSQEVTSEDVSQSFEQLAELYGSRSIDSLLPLLTLLTLKGQPFSIESYAPFEPLYLLDAPKRTLYKCGRQVAKTTNMAAFTVLHSAVNDHFATLFVAPRFEQVRRISTNYVRPFIENSMISASLQNKKSENSVLQKVLLNGSLMHFSFAFLDVDRIRGISVDAVNYDEIQDIDIDFVPIIRECMSASTHGIERFFGTPKTLDNTIQAMWEETSQAEWVMTCEACGKQNIPSDEFNIVKMIGPIGPVCVKCGRLLDPRAGQWVHAFRDRAATDRGYHVPQIILPMHYEDPDRPGMMPVEPSEKWLDLLAKRDGRGGFNHTMFMNEVLGESCDTGVKLVTLTDIRRVSVLHANDRRKALEEVSTGKYTYITLGVDWGGGGEKMISTTTAAVVGLNIHTGKTECIYACRLHSSRSHDEEARELLSLFVAFRCIYFCHDYGGSGSVRETLLIQAGLPMTKIQPYLYVRATTKKMVEIKQPSGFNQRAYFTIDKARSLVLQATAIKAQQVLLPEYESSKNITHDLLALVEERVEARGRADIFLITRNAKMTDDFAHALNFGCMGIWFSFNKFPDLAAHLAVRLSPEQEQELSPSTLPDE